MVAGLVAMGILSDEARDVGRSLGAHVAVDDEEAVELGDKSLLALEAAHETMNIVGNEPSILPGITLGVVVLTVYGVEGVEGLAELAFAVNATHETGGGVEETAVNLAAVVEVLVVFLVTEHLGHFGHTGVGEGILQSLGNGLEGGVEVTGDVAILLEQVYTTLVLHCRSLHSLIGSLLVGHKTLEHVVGEDGHAGVAHHTVGLVAHKMPYRQFALLLVDMDKGLCHISSLVGMDERHQRHVGTIGVPKRESGIVGEIATVYLVIGTTVFAIDVGEYRGSGHRVIHGGIEDGAVVGVAGFNLDFAQLGVPSLVGSLGYSVKVPTGHLGLHVEHGVALVDG